jgi:hypothetical protein
VADFINLIKLPKESDVKVMNSNAKLLAKFLEFNFSLEPQGKYC